MSRRQMIYSMMLAAAFAWSGICCIAESIAVIGGSDGPTAIYIRDDSSAAETGYRSISPEEAKSIMDSQADIIILDVREQDEYDDGHVPGAILIPYTEIEERAGIALPDKEQTILVYCRSGRRSKIASETLANMGYSNVLEFGGITSWPYDIATE